MLGLWPRPRATERRPQPWCGVWPQEGPLEASQRVMGSPVWRKKGLAGGEVFLNMPKYVGFHNRACAEPVPQ